MTSPSLTPELSVTSRAEPICFSATDSQLLGGIFGLVGRHYSTVTPYYQMVILMK
jgi:hypothetical protein